MNIKPAIIVLLILTGCGRQRPSVGVGADSVVSLADYFEAGERNVARALASASDLDGRFSNAFEERMSRAVVRVRVHHNFHDDVHSTSHATGAMVNGGKCVATVAHEMAVAQQYSDARIEIVLFDGRVLGARMRSLDHYRPDVGLTDWALLDVVDGPQDVSSLELGVPDGEERLVLGFAGRYGRDADDHVVLDDARKAIALRPLRILAHTSGEGAGQLELSAGCVPIGGMSGAPCIDTRGRLVSIQRGVSDTFSKGRASSTLDVVPIDGLRGAMPVVDSPK